jgi:hypothetical protein
MWSTSQKIKFFSTIFIIISWWFFFAYGQNNETSACITCWGPSIEITNFINLSNQIIDILPNNSTILAQWAQYHVFGPWQWWVYDGILWSTNPWSIIENIVAWTLKNFDKRQSYLRATTELLGIYGIDIIKDGWLWFLVTSQPRPIVRDYQLLLDIDTIVGDKVYEIGIAWWYGKKLPDTQLTQIKTLIKNNSGDWKLFMSNPIIDDSLTSTQLLALLLRLNNRFKKILTLWGTLQDNIITVWGSAKTTVVLNTAYFSLLQEHYACTRIGTSWKSCSSSFATFKKNIKNITKTFKEKWPKQSREKIEKASKRLATRALQIWWATEENNNFYKKNIDDYSQREQEILSSQWLTKRTWLGIPSGLLSSNIPRKMINTRSDINWTRQGIKNVSLSGSAYINNLTKNLTSQNLQYLFSGSNPDYILNLPHSPQQVNIASNLQTIITEHQSALTIQTKNTTSDTQEALSKTLFHIRVINNILYNNIKEDIARTCELQCSNLWWTCR